MSRVGNNRRQARPADRISITQEQHSFCRRRVAFLLREVEQPGERSLLDLLANAYHQGLEDAVATMDNRGWIRPPDTAPAQQDMWP